MTRKPWQPAFFSFSWSVFNLYSRYTTRKLIRVELIRVSLEYTSESHNIVDNHLLLSMYHLSDAYDYVMLFRKTRIDSIKILFFYFQTINKLISVLPNVYRSITIPSETFGHIDYSFNSNAKSLVFDLIVDIARQFRPTLSSPRYTYYYYY